MSGWFLYILMKLDDTRLLIESVAWTMLVVSIIGAIVYIVAFIVGKAHKDSKDKDGAATHISATNTYKAVWFFPFILLPISVFVHIVHISTPSTKQMAVIYVVPKVVNNEIIKEIPGKVLSIADEWLDKCRPGDIVNVVDSVTTKEVEQHIKN